MPFVIFMRPDLRDPESSVYAEVRLHYRERGRLHTEALQKLLGSLPPLRSIRPEALLLLNDFHDTPRGLFTGLLKHMIEHQVPRSVTEVDISSLAPLEAEPEIHQTFLEFEKLSCNGVQKLKLGRNSAAILLPPVVCFSRLASLTVDDTPSQGQLASLSGHPTLRELIIRDEICYLNVMTSLAAFRNIRTLHLECACEQWEDEDEDNNSEVAYYRAFGNMIHGMERLECLHTLSFPSIQFWEYVMESSVVSKSLRELDIYCTEEFMHEDLATMVQGLQTFTPSLTTLSLRVGEIFETEWDEHSIGALSGLRYHPSLTKLELATVREFGLETLSNLKQGLGNKVKLSHVQTF